MDIFEEFIKTNYIDIDRPDFDNKTKVHDWRNYVPYNWQTNWGQFTEREKKIIAVMAQMQADNEEWD